MINEKLPRLRHCFEICRDTISNLNVTKRFTLQARYNSHLDLNDRLAYTFFIDSYGPELLTLSIAGQDYIMELRARKNREFAKLFSVNAREN